MYKHNTEALWRNHCCRGRPMTITHSKCVFVVLVTQHAMRMRRVVLSSVASLATLSHKLHDFRKDVIEHKMCFDFLYNFRLKYFSFCAEFSEIL
jgi:hypothetical protein